MREKLIELLESTVPKEEVAAYGEVYVSTSRVADHLIANGVTIQKWIPVSERLPEMKERIYEDAEEPSGYGMYLESCEVLGYTTKGEVCICKMCDDLWDTYDVYDDVTHWMPLPEPPKEE